MLLKKGKHAVEKLDILSQKEGFLKLKIKDVSVDARGHTIPGKRKSSETAEVKKD